MKLSEARNAAVNALEQHGLAQRGWRFEFDNAKRRFGACHYGLRKITLSKHLVELNEWRHVENTILHEVAHALAPRSEGHGPEWRRIARSIGATGERCYSREVVRPKGQNIGTCGTCGHTIRRLRKITTLACGRCCKAHNGNKWSEAYVFTWTREA